MVAKLKPCISCDLLRLNLAKIHMVAKLLITKLLTEPSLNLAKIHMVAKLQGTEQIPCKMS